MLDKLKEKQNTLAQRVHDTYNHDSRKIVCIATGLIVLLCNISLQFRCEFIDSNRSNIFLIQNFARWVKFPTSILDIIYSTFILYELVKNRRNLNNKELAKIIGKSANLASSTIEVLTMLKVIHLLTRSAVSCVYLTSTILFLFVSEPIKCYYSCKKYQKVHKEYQDKKGTNEFKKFEAEFAKHKKNLFINILTLSLGLLNLVLRKMEIVTKTIDLGNSIIYNFNYGVTISIIYSAVFLVVQLDKLLDKPISDDLCTELELDSINRRPSNNINNIDFA